MMALPSKSVLTVVLVAKPVRRRFLTAVELSGAPLMIILSVIFLILFLVSSGNIFSKNKEKSQELKIAEIQTIIELPPQHVQWRQSSIPQLIVNYHFDTQIHLYNLL